MVSEAVNACVEALDALILVILPWLAGWILLSGLDDLWVDWLYLRELIRRKTSGVLSVVPKIDHWRTGEKRLAVFIPAWHEHAVIGRMLAYNLRAQRYAAFRVFVGVYPNDEPTIAAVQGARLDDSRVQLCLCPHDGPTSKADCLNWIYQHMLLDEMARGVTYDGIVLHDSEDVIDPQELSVIAHELSTAGMVQVPVLPLATPLSHLTHAVYCDDFAESQSKDLMARASAGGFLPSCGVGTGISRAAIEKLAERDGNRIFLPDCLTEDYELGYRLHEIGERQTFLGFSSTQRVATREFFPSNFRNAVKQRTRWITGIVFQGWERIGWGQNRRQAYWLWRDRKVLICAPLSVAANAIFFYGLATFAWSAATGREWGLASALSWVAWAGLALQLFRMATRTIAASVIYGPLFASFAPLRVFWANLINVTALAGAVRRYATARYRREPLVWLKTEHSFPSLVALSEATAGRGRAAWAGQGR